MTPHPSWNLTGDKNPLKDNQGELHRALSTEFDACSPAGAPTARYRRRLTGAARQGHPSWNLTGDKNPLKDNQGELHRALSTEFDAWAHAGRGAEMELGHRPTAEQALARFPFARMRRFLDVGCGNGYALRHAAAAMRPGSVAIGLDLSAAMLLVARDATPRTKPTPTLYLRGAFQALPLAADILDGVFSHEAIYYAPDVSAALREMHRVLAPGGLCVVSLDYFQENEYSHAWPQACGIPMTLDSEAGWRERFERAGFDEVASTRLFDRSAWTLPALPEDADDTERRSHELKRRWREQEGTLLVAGAKTDAEVG